ncbi:MAG: gamma-polyglutamate biosynthesis protein CapC, partial [Ilumatobacteraceae bacterium]
DLASMALTPLFVPGLLANDMDRTSPVRVAAGAGLAAAFVVPTTWWIQSIIEGGSLGLPWILLALSTLVTIFWKSARQLYRHYRPVNEAETVAQADEDDYSSEPLVELSVELEPALVVSIHEEIEAPSEEDDLDREWREFIPDRPSAEPTWPEFERRKAGRPWSDRPAAKVPDDLSELEWSDLVPNVLSIDSTGWSAKGNKRWQDAHPDAWQDADRWLADALTPRERDARVA